MSFFNLGRGEHFLGTRPTTPCLVTYVRIRTFTKLNSAQKLRCGHSRDAEARDAGIYNNNNNNFFKDNRKPKWLICLATKMISG